MRPNYSPTWCLFGEAYEFSLSFYKGIPQTQLRTDFPINPCFVFFLKREFPFHPFCTGMSPSSLSFLISLFVFRFAILRKDPRTLFPFLSEEDAVSSLFTYFLIPSSFLHERIPINNMRPFRILSGLLLLPSR